MFNHCNKKAKKNLINQEKDIEAKYLDVWMQIAKETGKRGESESGTSKEQSQEDQVGEGQVTAGFYYKPNTIDNT